MRVVASKYVSPPEGSLYSRMANNDNAQNATARATALSLLPFTQALILPAKGPYFRCFTAVKRVFNGEPNAHTSA